MNRPTPYRLTNINIEDHFVKVWGIVARERYECIENIIALYSERLAQGLCSPQSPSGLIPGTVVLVRYGGQFVRGNISRSQSDLPPKSIRVDLMDIGPTIIAPQCDIRTIHEIPHFRSFDDATPCANEYFLCDVLRRPSQANWSKENLVWATSILKNSFDVTIADVVAGKTLVTCLLNFMGNVVSFSSLLVERGLADLVPIEEVKSAIVNKYVYSKIIPAQYQVPPPRLPNIVNAMRPPYPYLQPDTLTIPTSTPRNFGPPGLYDNYHRTSDPRFIAAPKVSPQPFKVDTFIVDSQHEVCVSNVVDGMQSFTIQLKKIIDERLTKLMALINNIEPEPIDQLMIGTMCLGRHSADKTLCRAVVSIILTDGANLMFVDFGISEIVPFDEIYKIPPEFLEEKLMAFPFTLAGLSGNNALLTQEAQKIFSDLVINAERLIMVVTEPEIPLKQYCELFLNDRGKFVNIKQMIFDKVKLMKPTEYQKIPLKKNGVADVIVSYVESPHKFFVQLEVNQPLLEVIMNSVEEYCATAEMKEILYVEDVNENMAVCAQFGIDGRWYRGLITDEPNANQDVNVFYVDYGNQEFVHYTKLRIMNNEMISKFPMQAIECRLDTSADFALRNDVIDSFTDKAEGKAFALTVKNVLPAHVLLVDLYNEERESMTENLLKLFEEPVSPVTDFSSKSSLSHSTANNWRNRANSPNDSDFSSFRRDDVYQQRPRGRNDDFDDRKQHTRDVDEPDNKVRYSAKQSSNSDRSFQDTSVDRTNKRPSRDDWSNSDANQDDRSFKSRDDNNRRFDRDENRWNNNRDRDSGDRKTFRRQENGDGGERKPFRRREDSESWGSRDGDGGSFRKPFNRDDRRGGGGGCNRRNDEDWNMNRDDERDNRHPFKKRDDAGKSDWNSQPSNADSDRASQKRDSNWGNQENDSDRRGRRNNSDWGSRKNDTDWSDKKNYSDWNDRKNDSDWKAKSNDSDWGKKKNDSDWGGGNWKSDRDDRRPKRDGDFKSRDGGFNKRGGYGSSQTDGFDSTPSLMDGYPAGAQIAHSDLLCGQHMEVVISWFVNPVHFFVMPVENADFRQLMENIQSDYAKRKNADINNLSSGDYVVARDKDNVIYRAKVIQTRPGGATVTFIDYGNSESVRKDQIWMISPDHCAITAQAVCCGLHNISSAGEGGQWSVSGDLDKYFGKNKYVATFVECNEEGASKTWFISLIDENDANVADLLVTDGLAVKNIVLKSEELYDIELLRDQVLTVFPGHIESSKKFFVHIEPEKAEIIRESIDTLIQTPDQLVPLPDDQLQEGEFCLAAADDGVYYRAQILRFTEAGKMARIVYIDYGDENDVAHNTIKLLPDYLMVYNPQIFECCLHDAESFTDDDAFIDAISEKDFMIKVIDIKDNRLSVVVYDINGIRLPYPIEIDERVNVLCSSPVLKSCDKVYVSHMTSDKVYVNRTSNISYMVDLCDQLKAAYDGEEPEKVSLETGIFYVAKSKTFEAWYRCILPSIESQEVYYIDYGNSEPIEELLAVKHLDKKFFASPMYCVPASTFIKFTSADLSSLSALFSEITFNAVFKKMDDGWFVDLKCEKTGKTLADFADESGCAYELVQTAAKNDTEPYLAFNKWQVNEKKNVVVAHIESPNSFYLHLASDVDTISAMQRNLQAAMSRLLPVVGPLTGMCAMQKSDGQWCRAEVSAEGEAFAIDFGETLVTSRMKKLPRPFLQDRYDCYIDKFSLNVEPVDKKWSEGTVQRFVDIVKSGSAIFAKLEFLKHFKIGDLTVDGVSVGSTLINENLAQWMSHDVIVSHANSLNDFYVQHPEQEHELVKLANELLEAESWETVDPCVNDLVAAQFIDDQLWYRAVVTRIEDDVKYVRFVDYGNESTCDQFRVLPDSLKSIPTLADKCTLHSLPENAYELGEKFVNLMSAGEGAFSAYFLSRSEPMLVMLYYNNKMVEDLLLEKTEPLVEPDAQTTYVASIPYDHVVVSHINSPSSFYVQSEVVPLNQVEIALTNIENASPVAEPSVGDLLAALFPQDGVWYRAEVTAIVPGSITALFIDYGNSCVVEELRQLPESVKNIPYLAKHCAFSLPVGLEQWPDIAKQRFAELTCDGNTIFTLHVKEEGDPAYVDLQDNGVNVADELATLCKADLTTPLSETTAPLVVLSHVENVNELWVQFQTPQLDEMADEMANAQTFDTLSKAETGVLVAALFADDGIWYRAKVIHVMDAGYKVLFIDYGNKSDAQEIRSLPEDLVKLPPLAKCCRLKNLTEVPETYQDAVLTKLMEMVARGQTFSLNELVEEGDTNYVSLVYENNKNLAAVLSACCNSSEEVATEVVDSAASQLENVTESVVVADENQKSFEVDENEGQAEDTKYIDDLGQHGDATDDVETIANEQSSSETVAVDKLNGETKKTQTFDEDDIKFEVFVSGVSEKQALETLKEIEISRSAEDNSRAILSCDTTSIAINDADSAVESSIVDLPKASNAIYGLPAADDAPSTDSVPIEPANDDIPSAVADPRTDTELVDSVANVHSHFVDSNIAAECRANDSEAEPVVDVISPALQTAHQNESHDAVVISVDDGPPPLATDDDNDATLSTCDSTTIESGGRNIAPLAEEKKFNECDSNDSAAQKILEQEATSSQSDDLDIESAARETTGSVDANDAVQVTRGDNAINASLTSVCDQESSSDAAEVATNKSIVSNFVPLEISDELSSSKSVDGETKLVDGAVSSHSNDGVADNCMDIDSLIKIFAAVKLDDQTHPPKTTASHWAIDVKLTKSAEYPHLRAGTSTDNNAEIESPTETLPRPDPSLRLETGKMEPCEIVDSNVEPDHSLTQLRRVDDQSEVRTVDDPVASTKLDEVIESEAVESEIENVGDDIPCLADTRPTVSNIVRVLAECHVVDVPSSIETANGTTASSIEPVNDEAKTTEKESPCVSVVEENMSYCGEKSISDDSSEVVRNQQPAQTFADDCFACSPANDDDSDNTKPEFAIERSTQLSENVCVSQQFVAEKSLAGVKLVAHDVGTIFITDKLAGTAESTNNETNVCFDSFIESVNSEFGTIMSNLFFETADFDTLLKSTGSEEVASDLDSDAHKCAFEPLLLPCFTSDSEQLKEASMTSAEKSATLFRSEVTADVTSDAENSNSPIAPAERRSSTSVVDSVSAKRSSDVELGGAAVDKTAANSETATSDDAAEEKRVVAVVMDGEPNREEAPAASLSNDDVTDDSSSVYFDSCSELKRAQTVLVEANDVNTPFKRSPSSESTGSETTTSVTSAVASGDHDDGDLYVVCHVNTPGNFYVQRVGDLHRLRDIERLLRDAKDAATSPLPPNEVAAGAVCGAQIDDKLYRVRVLPAAAGAELEMAVRSLDDERDGVTVACLDYGAVREARTLFGLPSHVESIAPLATCCYLPLPCYLRKWPVNVCHEFEMAVMVNQPAFQLRVRETVTVADGSISLVDLLRNGRSVAQRMKTLCEEFDESFPSNDEFDSPDRDD